MSAREKRLSMIEKIVRTEVIRSQDDLQKSLIDKGFDVTQATLSRDIRLLKIVKTHDAEGSYVYMLPESQQPESQPPESLQSESLQSESQQSDMQHSDSHQLEPLLPTALLEETSVEFSGNLAVIKTRPGYAMGLAAEIDEHASKEVLGTIAGDDTILVIPREGYTRTQVKAALTRFGALRANGMQV